MLPGEANAFPGSFLSICRDCPSGTLLFFENIEVAHYVAQGQCKRVIVVQPLHPVERARRRRPSGIHRLFGAADATSDRLSRKQAIRCWATLP